MYNCGKSDGGMLMKKFIAGMAAGLIIGIAGTGVASGTLQFLAQKADFPVLVIGKQITTDKPIVTI